MIKVTSKLVPTTADGVLAESKHVYDGLLKKTQEEINADLYARLEEQKILKFKGSVETYENLPKDPKAGDVWNVESAVVLDGKEYSEGTNFAWTGTSWDSLGGISGNQEIENLRNEIPGMIDTKMESTVSWIEIQEN